MKLWRPDLGLRRPDCRVRTLQALYGYFTGTLRRGYFTGTSQVLYGYFAGTLRVLCRYFTGTFTGTLRVLYGYFTGT
jgi:hypothetical protein